jgi:hypothetical protein
MQSQAAAKQPAQHGTARDPWAPDRAQRRRAATPARTGRGAETAHAVRSRDRCTRRRPAARVTHLEQLSTIPVVCAVHAGPDRVASAACAPPTSAVWRSVVARRDLARAAGARTRWHPGCAAAVVCRGTRHGTGARELTSSDVIARVTSARAPRALGAHGVASPDAMALRALLRGGVLAVARPQGLRRSPAEHRSAHGGPAPQPPSSFPLLGASHAAASRARAAC